MLDSLRFVKGAVAKKDYQPAFTHFRIEGGRVLGFNGELAISCPIALDIDISPKATPFIKAIERCEDGDTVSFHVTAGHKLALTAGSFKAYIECIENDDVLAEVAPEGHDMPVPENFIEALSKLAAIAGSDASRPWSNGVLFRGCSAYATDNIVVVEYWLGEQCPLEINVPKAAIQEIIRIGEQPTYMRVGERTVTFFYEGDRWVRAQLYSVEWPDVQKLFISGNYTPIPDGLFEAIEKVRPFVGLNGRLSFRDGALHTSLYEDDGASVEVVGLPTKGSYHVDHLAKLEGVADRIDWSLSPAPFQGPNVRGVILGMVDA